MGRLEGKVAVVTGGSRGIGAAIATAFAREGARVAIVSRKREGVEAAAASIRDAVPEAVLLPVAAHVGQLAELDGLLGRVEAELGRPSVLVNNAGTNPYFGPMLGVDWPAWRKTFEVNLEAPFELTRRFAQRAFDAGGGGSIVGIASIAGARAAPMQGVYGMTKAALISMTQTFAVELRGTGLRINAIAPGLVETRLARLITESPQMTALITDRQPIPRPGTPDEVAGLAVFLASDESSYVSGQTIFCDGGFTIG